MIAVDTNILVYAHRRDSVFHERASQVVAGLAEGVQTWAIAWPCVHEFLSVATNRRIYRPPTALREAIDQVEAWMESPSLVLIAEEPGYWQIFQSLRTGGPIEGPKVHDARIAALCIQHGVRELWSADRDLGQFSDLRVVNPLP